MTWVTPAPTSPSAGEPATKFGIAIGSGCDVAFGECELASAPLARAMAEPPAPAPRASIRSAAMKRRRFIDRTSSRTLLHVRKSPEHLLRVESRSRCLSTARSSRPSMLIGLALQDGAHRALARRLVTTVAATADDHLRRPASAPIRLSLIRTSTTSSSRCSVRRLAGSSSAQPRAHRIELRTATVSAAVPRAIRARRRIQRAAPVNACRVGSRLSSSAAICAGSKLRSCFGSAAAAPARLCSRLRRGFLVFVLQRLGDRIVLGRIRLLFDRLRLVFGLGLGDRLRRLGLLLDRLLDRFRRRLGRRVGLDQLFLLGDLADRVFLAGLASAIFSTLGFGSSFSPVFCPAIICAELIGGDDVDRKRLFGARRPCC